MSNHIIQMLGSLLLTDNNNRFHSQVSLDRCQKSSLRWIYA